MPLDIIEFINANNGLISVQDAAQVGISRATLSYYCKTGRLERVAPGLYGDSGGFQDSYYALAQSTDKFVFSFESALYLNGLADRIPQKPSLTVAAKTRLSKWIVSSAKIHYVQDDLFSVGITLLRTTFGNEVPCYDAERTICDIIRSHRRMPYETYLTGIKNYLTSTNKNLSRLGIYARRFNIESLVMNTLEAGL